MQYSCQVHYEPIPLGNYLNYEPIPLRNYLNYECFSMTDSFGFQQNFIQRSQDIWLSFLELRFAWFKPFRLLKYISITFEMSHNKPPIPGVLLDINHLKCLEMIYRYLKHFNLSITFDIIIQHIIRCIPIKTDDGKNRLV